MAQKRVKINRLETVIEAIEVTGWRWACSPACSASPCSPPESPGGYGSPPTTPADWDAVRHCCQRGGQPTNSDNWVGR